jgi:dTDP-4-amino-4,6-dideoxygalactose transaminase
VAAEGGRAEAWFDVDADDPVVQTRFARQAALVVTDSAGWQEFAAALGTPCVAVPFAGWRQDLAVSGHLTVAPAISELPAAAHTALTHSTSPLPVVDVGANVATALHRFLHPGDLQPDTSALPSDGDLSGRTFDEAELAMVTAALRSGTLNSTKGTFVTRFEREFAQWIGRKHAIACASGSAAVHCAIAALGLSAGDEVITTPITDMGALTPLFYEGAVPVFADVDPATLNVTAATIEPHITARTRAVVVTHLFGRPCDLDAILALAERHRLPVIEDTAQAFGATWRGKKAGAHGSVAAFSLQQGKHITTGEGGIVCTDDDALARRVFLFVNKAWGYGDPQPDHYFPALNYRLTELQGAVACAQLPKLDGVVAARRDIAAFLRDELRDLPGIHCPEDPLHGTHSYWRFAFRVAATAVRGGAVALGARMREQGIACMPRYVQKPAFECQVFREWRRSPVTALPLANNPRGKATGPLFDRRDYPGATTGLEQVVVLPINERYRPEHLLGVVGAIRTAHRDLRHG